MMDTVEFLQEHYVSIIEGSGLPATIKSMLLVLPVEGLDELETAYVELMHFLARRDFYIVLDRIEQGQNYMATQTDPAVIAACERKIAALKVELEELRR